jgi:hypothetical protein
MPKGAKYDCEGKCRGLLPAELSAPVLRCVRLMSEPENRSLVTEKRSSGRSTDDLIKAFLGELENRRIVSLPIGFLQGNSCP